MKKKDKNIFPFAKLPADIRLYTMSFFTPEELARIARVGKQWKAESENNVLWKPHLKEILGDEQQKFSTDVFYKKIYIKKLSLLGDNLLEIMKNRKLKQAIEQAVELQKKCKLGLIVNYLLSREFFSDVGVLKNKAILKNGYSLVKEISSYELRNIEHYTVLHLLAACGESECVKSLYKMGFDINVCGPMWLTPLHIGVLHGQINVLQVLLELGANKAIRSKAWLFDKYPRVSPMELAAFLGKYELLGMLYNEKIKIGPVNSELVEDIKDSYGWGGRCFLECLISHFEDKIKTEFEATDKKISLHPVVDIYEMRENLVNDYQGDAAAFDNQLENILGSSNYARMKTLDFLMAHNWAAPEWFAKMFKESHLTVESEEPPLKMQKYR